MGSDIPERKYFKIGEVSKLADTVPHVIRYWESEFPQITPKRAVSKQRLYRQQDVALILQIKDLLHNRGYTIAGARKILRERAEEPLSGSLSHDELSDHHAHLSIIKSELLQLYKLLGNK